MRARLRALPYLRPATLAYGMAPSESESPTLVGGSADDDCFTRDDVSEPVVEALTVVCRACPVRVQCDALALEVEAVWGCWAGQWRTPQTLAASRRAA